MHPLGATLEQLFVGISAVNDDPDGYRGIKPRPSQSNQPGARLGFAPVFLAHRLHLRLLRPPQTSGIRQTKHPVGYARQTNHDTDDDEANAVSNGLSGLRSIPVVLKSGAEDLLAYMAIQRVVQDKCTIAVFRDRSIKIDRPTEFHFHLTIQVNTNSIPRSFA
jgi:hypothetical protein